MTPNQRIRALDRKVQRLSRELKAVRAYVGLDKPEPGPPAAWVSPPEGR